MKEELRAGIARHILTWQMAQQRFGMSSPLFFAVLKEEAAGRAVSRRDRDKLLRWALIRTEESVQREGYCPLRERDGYAHSAVLWILDEGLMPFLISAIPAFASAINLPWDSPRITVKSIMKSIDSEKMEFFEIDWPSAAKRVFFDVDRPILSSPEWNRSFGTPAQFLTELLDSRLEEVKDILEVFFFDDPLKLAGKSVLEDPKKPSRQAIPSPAMSEFPNRAVWLKARLEERGWNKHQLASNNGPDHKTTQKILDGVAVGTSVLDKVARGLSTKRGIAPVTLTQIPLD